MSTFGSYAVPVAATLLDVSTGAMLVMPRSAKTTWPSRAIDDAEGSPQGFRQVARKGQPRGRVVTLTFDQAHGDEFRVVRDALDDARGAGLIEMRHPDDDPSGPPTLWAEAEGFELSVTRPALHLAAFELTLEEHPYHA